MEIEKFLFSRTKKHLQEQIQIFLGGGQPMFEPNGPKNYIKMKTWSQGEGDASKILLCRSASENLVKNVVTKL